MANDLTTYTTTEKLIEDPSKEVTGSDLSVIKKRLLDVSIQDDVPCLEYRKDESNSSRTIEGWTDTLGAAQTASVWRIRATDVVGTDTHRQWARLSGGAGDPDCGFVHAWSDRASLFPGVAFLNQFSLQLSGSANAYLTVPDSSDIEFANTDAFSMLMYIKTTNGSAQTIMQKTSNTGGNNGYTVLQDSSGRIDFQFRGSGTGDRIRVRTDSLGTALDNGSWRQIIITKASGSAAASTVTIYIDGNDETLNVLNDTLSGTTTNSSVLAMGANIGGSSRFTGNIDEFAIWNAELTPAEVAEVYNTNSGAIDLQSGSGQIASALAAWWRMGDGSFSALPTIPDEEGSNDATAQSAIVGGDLETEVPP